MMRSLYSAVSGLKTHQTKMDVIGNNISNVNTEAFKSSTVRFSEIMYQTTASASGGNGAMGIGGTNAKQIGLGVATASTMVSITASGAAETTGNPFDLRLKDSQTTNFFIVSDGTNTYFTRAGSFYVDGNGYLCMSSTGYTLMGWQVDAETGEIRKDVVSPLQVMSPANQTSAPEATEKAYISGVLDKKDTNVTNAAGYTTNLGFYDDLGYSYTAKFSIKPSKDANDSVIEGQYEVFLSDIVDSQSKSILKDSVSGLFYTVDQMGIQPMEQTGPNGEVYYDLDGDGQPDQYDGGYVTGDTPINQLLFGKSPLLSGGDSIVTDDPEKLNQLYGYTIVFDTNDGTFKRVGTEDDGTTSQEVPPNGIDTSVVLKLSQIITATPNDVTGATDSNFKNIEIDFSRMLNYNNNGVSTAKMLKGDVVGDGTGKKLGALTGITVDASGCIYGSYDNGNTVLLGQIATAQFANASGLEKVGSNCYTTTLNSGEFDGIGTEISADGSKISSGELEMSNVDLSSQFTDMIITQRGFQANSRVITTSDTLLEELINLKR